MTERDQLIVEHKEDARRPAYAFWCKGGKQYDYRELESEARLALVKAAGDWDESRCSGPVMREGYQRSRFGIFLVQRIRWKLIRWVAMQRGGYDYSQRLRRGEVPAIHEITLRAAKNHSALDSFSGVERCLELDRLIRLAGIDDRAQQILFARAIEIPCNQIGQQHGIAGEAARVIYHKAIARLQRVAA